MRRDMRRYGEDEKMNRNSGSIIRFLTFTPVLTGNKE